MSGVRVVVVGGGGHARVAIETLRAAGLVPTLVLDDDPSLRGGEAAGVSIDGPIDERIAETESRRALLAVGDNRHRARIAGRLRELAPDLEWVRAVHPSAVVAPRVEIGPGSVVFAGAVVQPDTLVGAHAILNTAASVDHDGRLGDFVHVAPGARLAGDVTLEEGAFVGIGAAVVVGRTVGAWATVGAGGVVVDDVAPGTVVGGVPARPLRRRRSAEREGTAG